MKSYHAICKRCTKDGTVSHFELVSAQSYGSEGLLLQCDECGELTVHEVREL